MLTGPDHPCVAAGLAAVLPCFVVYLEVGKALLQQGGCTGQRGLPCRLHVGLHETTDHHQQ
jgi:hypothetical protein